MNDGEIVYDNVSGDVNYIGGTNTSDLFSESVMDSV